MFKNDKGSFPKQALIHLNLSGTPPGRSGSVDGSRQFPAWLAVLIGVLVALLLCSCGAVALWYSGIIPRLQEEITVGGSGAAAESVIEPTITPALSGMLPTWTPRPITTGSPATAEAVAPVPIVTTESPVPAATPATAMPDLVVTNVTFTPAAPVSDEPFDVQVTVSNQGENAAQAFLVAWASPLNGSVPAVLVASLLPGSSEVIVFSQRMDHVGTFTGEAIVDSDNAVAENDENNNTLIAAANIMPSSVQRLLVVTFDDVYIYTDADIWTDGDLFMEFQVNNQYLRWPAADTITVVNEERYNIDRTITVLLDEDEPLTLWVNGTDDNTGLLFGGEAEMGSVYQEYSEANQWGVGQNEQISTCPAGCYSIRYTIQVIEPRVIEITDDGFHSSSVDLPVGTTVVWVNHGSVAHSATADDGSFSTGEIPPGGFAAITFLQPGLHPYHCVPHETSASPEHGTLNVLSP